jgi:UrcA family protein
MSGMTPTLGGAVVQKKVIVKFDDLNPADNQGAAVLFARLNTVAGKLCASSLSGAGEMLADKVGQCQAKALKQAIKDVDTPALDAAASAK